MKKFITNDAWTGPDKKKHFVVGVVVALVVGVLVTPGAGFAASVTVAMCKEIYDSVTEKGTPSLQDFIVTAIGSGVGSVICEVFK